MLEKSFIEYLFEREIKDKDGKTIIGYLIPKYVTKGKEIKSVVQCLKGCLEKLSKNPEKFTISYNQGFNLPTIAHILKKPIDEINLKSNSIKTAVIDYILSLPLHQSFNKSMRSKSHDAKYKGWVYIFIIKDAFESDLTVPTNPDAPTHRSGNMLYLKFNFLSYTLPDDPEDTKNIQIMLDSLVLDVISIHPTDHDN